MKSFPIFTTHGICSGPSTPTHLNDEDFQKFLQNCEPDPHVFNALKKEHFNFYDDTDCIRKYITFDDGLESVLRAAEKMPFPGTVFVVTNHVGRHNGWRGQPGWVSREKCMNWCQLKSLVEQGWSVGAHSHNHPSFLKLNPDIIRYEIEYSKKLIEDRLGAGCDFFAYPYGHAPAAAKNAVEEFGMIGLGTEPGWAWPADSFNKLPRIEIYDLLYCNSAKPMFYRPPTFKEINFLYFRRLGGSILRQIA